MGIVKNKKLPITIIVVLLVTGSLVYFNSFIKHYVIKERKMAAQTTLNLFYQNLISEFTNLNYAVQLSYVSDDTGNVDKQMFSKIAQQLLDENEHLTYFAYFNGDILETILPEKENQNLIGKGLNELSYSYTLAKVIKKEVIEGPLKLSANNQEVYLFIDPIIINNEYKGEIVAALEKEYVLNALNFGLLDESKYDYELWGVNELGEHKTVVMVSDESVDFSSALKKEFTLPANWNISIQPHEGWLSFKERLVIDFSVLIFGMMFIFSYNALYLYITQRKMLQKARFTDPNSGLYNFKGFCYFVDQIIKHKKPKNLFMVYIHLTGYHQISPSIDREEGIEYFTQIYKYIQDDFPKDTISAKLSEDVITIAVFENPNNKLDEIIDDFILQLFWKININGKKEFVNPKYCIVTYPINGTDTKTLIHQAEEYYQQQYRGDSV